ncbi:hypothetical protein RRG08_003862 [Elysia crispata]|uniref:Uncharacterized protein n=1 Tax=Elysia crispata TaxID=231223 RepID=A0AAE0ZET5_9GAST|nr:hypothetical protein RRG08_003862 [Elysia crispata]
MSRKSTIAKEEEDEYNRDEKEERVRSKREKDRVDIGGQDKALQCSASVNPISLTAKAKSGRLTHPNLHCSGEIRLTLDKAVKVVASEVRRLASCL